MKSRNHMNKKSKNYKKKIKNQIKKIKKNPFWSNLPKDVGLPLSSVKMLLHLSTLDARTL